MLRDAARIAARSEPGGGSLAGSRRWLAAWLACVIAQAAGADVTLDGSVGPGGNVSLVGNTWQIEHDLGERVGENLFYSFGAFDITDVQTALFRVNPLNPIPSNMEPGWVIGRITGGSASEIFGRVQSNFDRDVTGTNLILVNPDGFSFGPDSALFAFGSIFFSTADEVRFGDAEPVFDARSSSAPLAFSMEPPESFGFLAGGPTPGAITFGDGVDGVQFGSLLDQTTLSFVGGDVTMLGTGTGTAVINGGSVEIVSIGDVAADVPLDAADFDARSFAAGELGRIDLENVSFDMQSTPSPDIGAGRVVLRGGQLVLDGVEVLARNFHNPGPNAEYAVDFEASESLWIGGGSEVFAGTPLFLPGQDGTGVRLSAPDVTVTGAGTQFFLQSFVNEDNAFHVDGLPGDAFTLSNGAQVLVSWGLVDTGTESPVVVTGGSATLDGATLGVTNAGAADLGPIHFDVGDLTVTNAASLQSVSQSFPPGGKGSDIDIRADRVLVSERGQIVSVNNGNSGPASGGNIEIRATELVEVASLGKISAEASSNALAPGGDVTVRVTGEGGELRVIGQDTALAETSQISAVTVSTNPAAAGGDLTVRASKIVLEDGGQLIASTRGAAPGGRMGVRGDDLEIHGFAIADGAPAPSGLFARAEGFGDGGEIRVNVARAVMTNGAEVSARTTDNGNAGSVFFTADQSLRIEGGEDGPSIISARGAAGDGGDIVIATRSLEMTGGGQASASTTGTGDAGIVRVRAGDVLIAGTGPIEPSGLFSQSNLATSEGGAAGGIRIEADRLKVLDDAVLSVLSAGGGSAGDIVVDARIAATFADATVSAQGFQDAGLGSIVISGGQQLAAFRSVFETSTLQAEGGRVALQARDLVYLSDSRVESFVPNSTGDAGDVTIPVPPDLAEEVGVKSVRPRLVAINRSDFIATAREGDGGDIFIDGESVLVSGFPDESTFDATSDQGVSGLIVITAPDSELAGQVTPLPSNFFDASELLRPACAARTARAGSFVVQTRAAVQPPPDSLLSPSLAGDPVLAGAADPGQCPI